MLNIGFDTNLSEHEIETMIHVFKHLGRKSFWEILKVVSQNPDLSQQEIASMVYRVNISKEINFMVRNGLIEEQACYITETKRIKKYKLIPETFSKFTENARTTGMSFFSRFILNKSDFS